MRRCHPRDDQDCIRDDGDNGHNDDDGDELLARRRRFDDDDDYDYDDHDNKGCYCDRYRACFDDTS